MLQLLVVAPPEDAPRIREALATMQTASTSRFVETTAAGLQALREQLWDALIVVISDVATDPSDLVGTFVDLAHGAAVIVVAGSIGEDTAAGLIRNGAADVVSMARITRLLSALERELRTKSRIVAHQQTSRTAYSWFASIINNIPVGIVYHNERGEIVLCNETALTLLGLTEDEFLGVTSLDPRWNIITENGAPIPGSEHPSSVAARTKNAVRNVRMGVFRPRTNDRVWLKVDAIPVLDAEKRLAHVVVKFSDVTEQKRMSDALRASEERFRSAFEHSGIGMFLASRELEILQANATACRFFGRTPDTLVGKKMPELTHPEDIDLSWRKREVLLEPGQRSVSFEKRYLRPSGDFVWGAATVDVIPDEQGNPTHFVVTIQDITARKDAEADRNRLQAQLLQAQKMEALGILAGGVAHDFNNILAAISCSSDLLLQDLRRLPNTGEMPEIVFELQQAAQRGADLVRQILTFSRRANQRRTPIKLGTVIQEHLSLIRKTSPTNAELRVSLRANPWVLADATQMQQVVANLCTNALHALEGKKGLVHVELDVEKVDAAMAKSISGLSEGLYARIRVSDDGIGMNEHTLEHIFEPFFTTRIAGNGTGLGMAVVHGIIVAHEGAIRIQSQPNHGTTIDVWFGVAQAETEKVGEATKEGPRGNNEHILVVDDEQSLARVFGRLLQSIGYRVTIETHSAKALEFFEKYSADFQLAFIDLHMPPPGGIEVAKRLHQLRPDLPIFIMSGFSDALRESALKDLGVVGILQKPITRDVLATELRRVLDPSPTP